MSIAGRGILVTRPIEQAQGLATLIERAGGRALLFPALEIVDLPAAGALGRLNEFDFAIFASPTAVDRAMRQLEAWPAGLSTAAIGAGTRRELDARGISGVIAPEGTADSEALLALPQLKHLAGKRVLIVRGQGGRALLGETLQARGARVEYAECYRRTRPEADPAPVLSAWETGELDAVTVSSIEGLENLTAMLGAPGAAWLEMTPLFVPHERVATYASRMGARRAIVAAPGDGEMLERLVAYFSR